MRIAIVGGGPRGLFAVERLWAHLPAARDVHVAVLDPQTPGVGAAYCPSQPPYLRLNVTSAVVSAGWPGEDRVPSFDQWRIADGEEQPLEPFPPRARVGEYLSWFWAWLCEHRPPGSSLSHRRQRVLSITRLGRGWAVDSERFDEVLLATGHENTWPGALCGNNVVRVFPVDTWLTQDRVPAGSSVAMRGAALTFVDAALALTQGRGGRFEGDWQSGLTYRPTGREPRTIWPVARSGRWMDPKPQPGSVLATPSQDVIESGRLAVLRAATPHDALAAVERTALDLGADPVEMDALLGPLHGSATALLRARLAAVSGAAAHPTAAWALGHAWRRLYDSLRARFEGTGAGFGTFAALAGRLERVAFGPPPVNAAKLVALIDAGIIDPVSLGTAHFSGATPVGLPASPDVVVDAVLPPAGVVAGSLIARLVDDGVLTTRDGRRGVAVGQDASCLDRHGHTIDGLACIGRATEDVVIGNDTLNRAMHPAVDGWARRIAGKGTT